MNFRIIKGLSVIATAALLAACTGDDGIKETDPSATQQPSDQGQQQGSDATTTGAAPGAFDGHVLDNPDSLLYEKVIYFEYDSSEILGSYREKVEAHGSYLANNPSASVTLEGHADERGSREYNIALGERRANSVRQLMTLLGAGGAQIRVVSYGEERPAVDGHDEFAWEKNRRVEIIYRNR